MRIMRFELAIEVDLNINCVEVPLIHFFRWVVQVGKLYVRNLIVHLYVRNKEHPSCHGLM